MARDPLLYSDWGSFAPYDWREEEARRRQSPGRATELMKGLISGPTIPASVPGSFGSLSPVTPDTLVNQNFANNEGSLANKIAELDLRKRTSYDDAGNTYVDGKPVTSWEPKRIPTADERAGWNYGSLLPVAHNTLTGEWSPAIPELVRNAAKTAVDVPAGNVEFWAEDPATGERVISPEGVNATLDTMNFMVGGGGMAHGMLGAGEHALGMNAPVNFSKKLVVAMRHPQTGETIYGKPGQVHGDLYNEHNLFPNEGDIGFAAGEGAPFMGRSEAFDFVNSNDPGTALGLNRSVRHGKLESNDLAVASGDYVNAPPLVGMPTTADIPGMGSVPFGPTPSIRQAALDYMKEQGLPYSPPRKYVPVDPEKAAKVADEFEKMKHDPTDPQVAKSYSALIDETKKQFQAIQKSGLNIEFIKPGMEDPYKASPRLAQKDIVENNHLWVFPTEGGFGPAGAKYEANHPMLADSGIEIGGYKLKNNDLFRIVHDIFGHAKEGVGFRATGEDNAFRQHRAMFTPEARKALATETRGQNSWLNFGPHGAKNRTATADQTIFADQKVGLLPDWAVLYANNKKAAPLGLVPAMRTKDGEVILGQKGDIHADIWERNRAKVKDDPFGFEDGFATPDGQFLSREEAMSFVQKNDPKVATALRRNNKRIGQQSWDSKLDAHHYGRLRGERYPEQGDTYDPGDLYANNKKAAPLGLVPAMRKDGRVYAGHAGETHGDVYLNNPNELTGQFEEGFVLPDGKYLTRQEALQWVDKNQPDIAREVRAGLADRLDVKPQDVSILDAFQYQDAPARIRQKTRMKSVLSANNKNAAPLSLAVAEQLTPQEQKWVAKGMTPEQAQIMSVQSQVSPKKPALPENVPFNFSGIGPEDTRISTRVPQQTTEKGNPRPWVPDAHNEHLSVDTETMSTMPSFEHNMSLIKDYPGFGKLAGLPAQEVADRYINQTVGNTLHLYSRLPGEVVERSPRWYEGAQRLAGAFAEKWGIPRYRVSSAIAALSPQKDWFQNASLAQRVGDIMFGDAASKAATKDMIKWAKTATKANSDELLFSKPEDQALIKEITGKRFDELTNDRARAMWVRAYDEVHNPRFYREITPEGEIGPWSLGKEGQAKVAWGSMNEIEKAVSSLRALDPRHISTILSDTHKVRSFYNNIENPWDARFGDATVDTHQVGGSQLRSVTQKDRAVLHNFDLSPGKDSRPPNWRATASAGSNDTGIHGTYPLLNDTLRQTGDILGLLPRQVQSPTWEGIRLRFPAELKGSPGQFNPDLVWRAYERGEISLDQARDLIIPEGSIPLPSYADPGYVSVDPRFGRTYVNPKQIAPLSFAASGQDKRR